VIAQLADISFGYPGTELFSHVSFQINPGQRIGLVGPNGAGKSTLLRLLCGELAPDSGQVVRARGRRLSYMHQSQEFHGHGTLWETLLLPFASLLQMRQELSTLEHEIASADGERADALLKRYGELEHEYSYREGYTLESRARALAHDLGFTEADLDRSVASLSGGERGRVELAKVLLDQPDLLLLDEPTNHLDAEAVEHLEERLAAWPETRALLLVSHDRYFLQAVCNEIVDCEDGELVRYPGSYEKYVVARDERHERLNAEWERQQEQIARTEDFIRKNIAGQKTKQAQSRRKMLEKLDRVERHRDTWSAAGDIGLRFTVTDHRGGKEVLRCENVELGYGDGPALVRDLTMTIYRGERVGIVGPNGAGKTTLLKALIGRLLPRHGFITLGHEVRIGYFDQKLEDLNEDYSLIEEIRTVRGDWNEDVVRGYLGRFRFTGEDGFKKVKGLSGGERNRLQMAKLMLRPYNLLAMDEPTNHLDIAARETLEEALTEYEGSMVVVSHDRYFLDRVVNKILHLDAATGRIDAHVGNYSDYRRRLAAAAKPPAKTDAKPGAASRGAAGGKKEAVAPVAKKAATPAPAPADSGGSKEDRMAAHQARKDRERSLERKQKRLAQLETEIEATERAIATLREQLANDHGGEWQRLNTLVSEEQALDGTLRRMIEEWEALGSELSSS
jgi:ATP-binding cassette subfamily F protein 3